ncbi:MAG: hypothetical protein GF329_19480 [Candidatus Lokiarchaeota archaeon]|nr:hypothetical protein [Candidatus Lokiarchaeota archaeon]
MNDHKEKTIKNNIFISHHDENHLFFERHVFIIGGYAVCIGCLAELFAMFTVIIIFFIPNSLNFMNNIFFYSLYVNLSPQLNFFIYIYRFFTKDEFPNKYIRFLGRYFLTLGLLACIYGITIKHYLLVGLISLIVLGSIFFLLRKYSNEYLMRFYENEFYSEKKNH